MSALFLSQVAFAQPSKGGRKVPEVKQIDQEEGRRVIERFRGLRLKGDFIFNFKLSHRPRRGEKKHYKGLLFGTWNESGPLSRMALWPDTPSPRVKAALLVQGGKDSRVHWADGATDTVLKLGVEDLLTPFLDDLVYTPFDLLMPFVYWDHFRYEESKRGSISKIHRFLIYPPADFKAQYPNIKYVRLKLDDRFNALMGAEVVDQTDKVIRKINVQSFKKVAGQYIPKGIDVVDKTSKNTSSLLKVYRAVTNADLPDAVFAEAEFDTSIPDVSKYRFERL